MRLQDNDEQNEHRDNNLANIKLQAKAASQTLVEITKASLREFRPQ